MLQLLAANASWSAANIKTVT